MKFSNIGRCAPNMSKNIYPTLASTVMAVIFGLSFLFTKGLLSFLSPLQLLGLRFAVAALTLTLLWVAKIIKLGIRFRDLSSLLGVAFLSPGLYFLFETYGVKLTSASVSGIIIALLPVVTAILAYFMLGERIAAVQGVFIVAAVAGVIFMALGGENGPLEQPGLKAGIMLLIGAIVSAGLFNIFSSGFSR